MKITQQNRGLWEGKILSGCRKRLPFFTQMAISQHVEAMMRKGGKMLPQGHEVREPVRGAAPAKTHKGG